MDSGYWQVVAEEEARKKTGIIQPGRKAAVESDSYGGPKCSYIICINEDEDKNVMGHTS